MTRDTVLDPTERRLWRRYERGLMVVQIGNTARPRSGEDAHDWMSDERVRTVLERLREYYGSDFETAIATAQTEPRVRKLLADIIGADVPNIDGMHYGGKKAGTTLPRNWSSTCTAVWARATTTSSTPSPRSGSKPRLLV